MQSKKEKRSSLSEKSMASNSIAPKDDDLSKNWRKMWHSAP